MPTPDPVSQPNAYREMLLCLLGDDDPDAVQSAAPDEWRALVKDAGDDLRTRPADGEWSVLELLGHAADAELVCGARYRWVVAHDEPHLLNYDQDLWVARLRHNDADPQELLDVFETLRRANVALWRRTSGADKQRIGVHEERGPESFDIAFRMIAGHDRFHFDQARETLAATRAKR